MAACEAVIARKMEGLLTSTVHKTALYQGKQMNDLLQEVAKNITSGRELMGSKWGNSEAETIACQALSSCAYNERKHNDAFTWYGNNLNNSHGNGLVDNPKGINTLINDESIIVEQYNGTLTPPENTATEDGKPLVIRVTPKLIYYAASEVMSSLVKESPQEGGEFGQ